LGLIAIVGVIVKLFLGNSQDSSSGPATSSVWGYGIMAVSVVGLMVSTFAMTSQMKEVSESSFVFIKSLFLNSLPSLLMLGVLVWLIVINAQYYNKINTGNIANEYSIYNNVSTFMVVAQLWLLYSYLVDELKIKGSPNKKTANQAVVSKHASIMYLLTIGNITSAIIMTIILKYFTTDG
jgi:hypothetical protein